MSNDSKSEILVHELFDDENPKTIVVDKKLVLVHRKFQKCKITFKIENLYTEVSFMNCTFDNATIEGIGVPSEKMAYAPSKCIFHECKFSNSTVVSENLCLEFKADKIPINIKEMFISDDGDSRILFK